MIGVFFINLDGLITTVSASTAAIVAIVGGLLISRLLSLSSEKNGISRRLKELQEEVKVKVEQSDEISGYLLLDDAKDFIDENGKEIIIDGIAFEELVDLEKSPYRSADELRPFIEKLLEVKEDFYNIIKQEDFELPENFEYFYKHQKLSYCDRRYYYENIYNLIDAATNTSRGLGSINYSALINTNMVAGITDNKEQRTARDRLDGEITLLNKQIDVQRTNLESYGRPDGLWSGLLVIVYACVVGVVWPCMLLPYNTSMYNDMLTKWTILGLFMSALLVLFIYIAWSTYRLTRNNQYQQ